LVVILIAYFINKLPVIPSLIISFILIGTFIFERINTYLIVKKTLVAMSMPQTFIKKYVLSNYIKNGGYVLFVIILLLSSFEMI